MHRLRILLLFFLASSIFAQFGLDQKLIGLQSYTSFYEVQPGSKVKIAVRIKIEDEWHINSNQPKEDFLIASNLSIIDENISFEKIVYPKAEELKFDFSEQPVSVFEGEIYIGGVITIPESAELGQMSIPLRFSYQACNNITCMPPNDEDFEISLEVVSAQTPMSEINPEIFSQIDMEYGTTVSSDDNLASVLESSGLLIGLIIVFFGGLALNLTPCVYPLIPITIGYFGGQSEGRTGKLFVLGLLYVLGMSITYSVVGVVTALSGAVFGTLMQNSFVIAGIALVFILLSLSMFGMYEFKLPDSWVMKAGGAQGGLFGAFFMGLTMGIVAAPCIGPFVLGLVTYVAAKGDAFFGFIMFFVLALGLGTPYLFLALFSGKIKNLPRAGFWMEAVKHIFGWVLIGMAVYFLGPILPKSVNFYALPIFMIVAALYLLFVDKLANDVKAFRIFKTVFSAALLVTAIYWLYPTEKAEPDWNKFSTEAYQASLENGEKIIIDFYADWCIPCKELDGMTFSDERVIKKSEAFSMYKVDMTKTMDDATESIRNKFTIKGMPTVLIINKSGAEVYRLTGFVNANEFLKLMEKAD